MEKVCNKCGNSKPIEDFHKKKGSPDGRRNQCKNCVEEYMKEYRKEHKDDRADYDKKRYEENREEILEHKKQYHQENKEEILQKKREYRKTDEAKEKFKLWRENNKERYNELQRKYKKLNKHEIAWRSILHRTLKQFGNKKEGHTINLLGYSALDLKSHLESLFLPEMNWDNYGEWQIDHIVGVRYFNADTPVSVVCALSNLQPLWKTTREVNGITYEGNLNKKK
jgi:hypothetical protein